MSFQIRDIVGNYRVSGLLGSGGTGFVYRVEHTITGQTEAMKVLLESGSADRAEQAERFLREIKLQARLHHPNIAAVHNAFWADDRLVMVMEFVEGEPLEQRLAQGRIPLPDSIAYMQQVLSALSYAHACDVIHRDIKPANLIIARQDGAIKVMDFGLARSGSDPKLTQTGAVAGSLYYISPEQVKALPNIDGRADIYSLGAVFYEVVTGRKPFPIDQAFELMSAHVHELPKPPIELEPSLPRALNDAILRAMAKDPAERFQSSDEFFEAIRRVVDVPGVGSGEHTRQDEGRELSQHQGTTVSRMRPRWLQIAAAAVLVAAVALLYVFTMEAPPADEVSQATASGEFELLRGLRVEGSLTAAAFSPDNRWVAAGTSNHRIKIWNARTAQEYTSLEGHTGAITALAFSADGNRLASGSADKTARLWDLPTRQTSTTLKHDGGIVSLVFSPDGRKLAAGTPDRMIHLWNADTGESLLTLAAQVEPVMVAFGPDGERLAAAGPQIQVQLWNLSRSTTASQLLEVGSSIAGLRFRPDGSLATVSNNGLQEWDLVSLHERKRLPVPATVSTLAYTPRGDCMVVLLQQENVAVLNLTAAQEVGLLEHGRPVTAAWLNADGLKAATYSEGGDLWLWQATPSLVAEQQLSDYTAGEAKPTPFAKAEEEVKNDPQRPVRKIEGNSKRKKGAFRRFLGIFR